MSGAPRIPPLAFYCLSSELYFPGAVGLVNSLRLVGHDEPVFLLDCGLSDAHRELLAGEATIVPAPAQVPPYLLKTVAPMRHPAEVMVLIDVDMILTRSLAPLIDRAAGGAVVAVKDNIDRCCESWGSELGLGPAESRPYVSSGLVVLGGAPGARALKLWDEGQGRVDFERSYFGRDEPGYAFRFLDQDVLNAVISTSLAEDEAVVLGREVAPHQPYRGLRIESEATLRCAYRDGSEPYVLHQYLAKPWVKPMYHGIYSRLLSRLWLAEDVAIALPANEVPRRMRRGPLAFLERKAVDVADLVRWHVRDVIPEWIEARRAARRERIGERADGA